MLDSVLSQGRLLETRLGADSGSSRFIVSEYIVHVYDVYDNTMNSAVHQ